LKLLAADFAVEIPAAGLLVQLDFDRLLVVAEKACESRRQGVPLAESERCQLGGDPLVFAECNGTFLGPCGLLELLRLPMVGDVLRSSGRR
jgi:hypothetical protein